MVASAKQKSIKMVLVALVLSVAAAAPAMGQGQQIGQSAGHSVTGKVGQLMVIVRAPAPAFGADRQAVTTVRSAGNVDYIVRVRLTTESVGIIRVRDAAGVYRTLSTSSDVVIAQQFAGKRDVQVSWQSDVAGRTLPEEALSYSVVALPSEMVVASAR